MRKPKRIVFKDANPYQNDTGSYFPDGSCLLSEMESVRRIEAMVNAWDRQAKIRRILVRKMREQLRG